MELYNLYATPIYTAFIENTSVYTEIDTAIKLSEFDGADYSWGKTVNVTTLNEDIISKFSMNAFESNLNKHIVNYCDSIGFDVGNNNEFIRKSWLCQNPPNSYTHVHDHTHTDISGVFYFKTNENDGDLFFLSPSYISTSYCFQNLSDRFVVKPKIGKLVIFPSWVLHGVKTNLTDDTRISLAFSISFKRK